MPNPDLKNAGRIIRLWALMRIVLAFLFFAIVRLDQSMIAIMILLGLALISIYRYWRIPKLVHLAGFRGIQFLIDPLADRVFLIAAVASLVSLPENILPIWPAYALAFRDVFLAFFFLGALFQYKAANFESLPESGYDVGITVAQYGILAAALLLMQETILVIASSLLFLLSIRSCVTMMKGLKEIPALEKSGQLTLSTIVAVLIIIVVSLIIVGRQANEIKGVKPLEKDLAVDQQREEIEAIIHGCVSKVTREGVMVLGQQGGYFNKPEAATKEGEPFYIQQGMNYAPSVRTIEEQLASYINANLRNCLATNEKILSAHIEDARSMVKTSIGDNEVSADVSYPIILTIAQRKFKMKDDIKEVIATRFGEMIKVAQSFTAIFLETGGISITRAAEVYQQEKIKTHFDYRGEEVVITLSEDTEDLNRTIGMLKFALQ